MSDLGDDTIRSGPWQFSLRAVFCLVAWAACITAWATIRGAGVVVLAVGLSVSALNVRGALNNWQLPSTKGRRLVYCGWMLLLVSLFAPSVRGCGNAPVAGWEAAAAAADVQFRVPGASDAGGLAWSGYGFYSLINLGNLLLLVSPWALYRARRGKGQAYGALLGVCAVAAWSLPISQPQEFLVGYYVWSISLLCVLSAFRLSPRTMAAMIAFALVWLMLVSKASG